MLISTSTNGPSVIRKQIVIYSTTDGEILYTVPIGRKFIGTIVGPSSGASSVQINGVTMSFGGGAFTWTPIELLEGTVVNKLYTAAIYIFGIEENA